MVAAAAEREMVLVAAVAAGNSVAAEVAGSAGADGSAGVAGSAGAVDNDGRTVPASSQAVGPFVVAAAELGQPSGVFGALHHELDLIAQRN